MSNTSETKPRWSIAPYFIVDDVVATANHYRDKLGFRCDRFWGEPPCFCMPHRDGLIIMLSQECKPELIRPNSKARGDDSWDAYVWVKDADALYAEVKPRGANVIYGPLLQEEYGNREFAVRDLDGYILAFGSDASAKK